MPYHIKEKYINDYYLNNGFMSEEEAKRLVKKCLKMPKYRCFFY